MNKDIQTKSSRPYAHTARVLAHTHTRRLNVLIACEESQAECLNANAPYVAVENPLPMQLSKLPPPTCYACPSWFGVKYSKKTLYWLRNLPPLMAECVYSNPKSFVHSSRGKYRSRTFPQLAMAIAKQWKEYIYNDNTIQL